MLIKACLNGSRAPGAHPALPLTPEQLAGAARLAVDAGAGALHVHPRRADGTQSLEGTDIAAALVAIRAACPGIPVGISTGIWIEPDVERRRLLVATWDELPDFAGVNFSEPGALDLCAALLARGIGVEAGLWTPADAQLLIESNLVDCCLRLLIEPMDGVPEAALETVQGIERHLDGAGVQTPRLLHGTGGTAWPMLELALRRGYDTRIGFEDTLTLPDGRQAQDNAELVATAWEYARRIARMGERRMNDAPAHE